MWRSALVFFICAVSLADEASPSDVLQMPVGQEALVRYGQASVAARETFYRTMIDADERKIADLDRAMKIAMNVANLDEANRIKAAQRDADDVLKQHKETLHEVETSTEPVQPEAPQSFPVFASERWKMTVAATKGGAL